MDNDTVIRIDAVSKTFKLPHERHNSIKSWLINLGKHEKGYEPQQVLDGVSIDIKKGEFFGIVGRNGSGKSTLLKMLAGIYTPTKGRIDVKGKLTPFIELGVGFNPELTGRENVFLNGALLGFNRHEMEAMYDDIVTFAELERFMDQKLKNYSSGMQVRLAFSIAIRVKSDILLLDEVLAVGDAAFQKKCLEYFSFLKAEKQTVVFVSHDMASMQKYCDRIAWIDKGELRMLGSPRTVTEAYLATFVQQVDETESVSNTDLPLGIASAINIDKSQVTIEKVWLENQAGKSINSLSEEDDIFLVNFLVRPLKDVSGIVPGVIITNDMDEFITASNSVWGEHRGESRLKRKSIYRVSFTMPNIFEKGSYAVSVNVVAADLGTFYAWKNKVCALDSNKVHTTGGKVNPKFAVEVRKA